MLSRNQISMLTQGKRTKLSLSNPTKGENMSSLFVKTILRVLIIFLPVISLSFVKDTYSQQSDSVLILGIGVILFLGILLGVVWQGRKTRRWKGNKNRSMT